MNRMIDKFVFALYVLPLIFICMYVDWKGYSMFISLFVILLFLAAASHFMWYAHPKFIWIGNIISLAVSLICVFAFLPDKEVGTYFKPFGTVGTLVIFTLLSCMFQYIIAWLVVKFGRRVNNEY
ncbi:hypothetical protein [Macrococcoides caseolyticum]|uniref:hypothetical protein n=1 Tax=Macrococcoides caseolyticum TaxID=69966 RepID=UPI000C31C913|nr:hypothetical protein [Macrococcus caseolyticus]PKD97845.1 hypothetical protein CW719_10290 [Macrococcus caseolyticus]PKE19952.1 hypothetical protein CW679_04195 [Macrococcus caseolyticus]PKE50309.1 hypothetical protein CW672_05780 [Macrococcus caseolyticus]PKF18323.1 hypothetical protein CW717_10285 [Macrococcus caseolyticus]PKF21091.1 hypothetical protein CW684_07025 [Macrococcus caseolyticus]